MMEQRKESNSKPSMWTAHISTQIVINAHPEAVWNILMDFENYPRWNPFIRQISGQAKKGEKLHLEMLNTPTAAPMRFSPRVLTFEPSRELRWLGKVIIPGLLDAEHWFVVAAQGTSHTRFRHSERFSGVLVPMFKAGLLSDTTHAFNAMNLALKSRVESAVAAA